MMEKGQGKRSCEKGLAILVSFKLPCHIPEAYSPTQLIGKVAPNSPYIVPVNVPEKSNLVPHFSRIHPFPQANPKTCPN